MKLSELKQIYQAFVELRGKFAAQSPDVIEKALKKALKVSNISKLPQPLQKAFKDYKKAFAQLENACKEMKEVMSKFEEQHIPDSEGNSIALLTSSEETGYEVPAKFIKSYNFLPICQANLELERQIAYRDRFHPEKLSFATPQSKKTVLFTQEELAPGFFQNFIKDINNILAITSGPLDNLTTVNQVLKQHTHDQLNQAHINQGFYKDGYTCYFQNQAAFIEYANRSPEASNVEKRVDDFVNQYVAAAGLPEAIKPNLKAMLTTLTYQSGLSNNSMNLIAALHSFNYNFLNSEGTNKLFGNAISLSGATFYQRISFDEKFRLRIEYFCIDTTQGLVPIGKYVEAPYIRKIGLTLDITAENSIPSFKLANFDFAYTTSIPKETAKNFELVVTESALKEPRRLDKKTRDSLRGCLENLAKFAGYDSLPKALYDLGKVKTLEDAKINSKRIINFAPTLFSDLEKKAGENNGFNDIEINFLNNLHTAFYKNHASKEKLITKIFTFFSQQFTQIPFPDQLRYVYLLKMAKDLRANPKNIDNVFDTALHELFDKEKNLTANERSGLKAFYRSFYNGRRTKEELNILMKTFVEERLKEFTNLNEDLNKERYTYFINLAIDYSIYSVEQATIKLREVFTPKETVKILSRRHNRQQSLFEAAKADTMVYQEIVVPTEIPSLFNRLKKFLPVWLGGTPSRPQFSPEQHLQIMAKHSDLLDNPHPDNPYRKIRESCQMLINQYSPRNKLNFLLHYINDISNQNEKSLYEVTEKFKNLGENFFDNNLKEYLTQNNFQNLYTLIKTGTPFLLQQLRQTPALREAFSAYAQAGTLEDKLNKIVAVYALDQTHIKERFGPAFITHLEKQIQEEMDTPTQNLKSICKIFEKNPGLYEALGFSEQIKASIIKSNQIIARKEAVLSELKTKSEDQADKLVEQTEDESLEESLKESLTNTVFKPLFFPPVEKQLQTQPSSIEENTDNPLPNDKDNDNDIPSILK